MEFSSRSISSRKRNPPIYKLSNFDKALLVEEFPTATNMAPFDAKFNGVNLVAVSFGKPQAIESQVVSDDLL